METNWGPSQDSLRSGRIIVPLVMHLMKPASVVDVGCKLGEWLITFRNHGVTEFLGIDRPLRQEALVIPPQAFRTANLAHPFTIPGRFDLAVCLEVAEHLPAAAARPLVRELTAAAPVVLFSAAIPGQGGHGHVNEQPHDYWHRLFAAHDFVTLDCIRPAIWQNPAVAYWYRQNTFLYASRAALQRYPALQAEYGRRAASDMVLIHAEVLRRQRLSVKIARRLPVGLKRALSAVRGTRARHAPVSP